MAVITKKGFQTQRARDLQAKATQQSLAYNPQVQQILQQQELVKGQQQALTQGIATTIGDMNRNIYLAQRQQRASNAALGLIGQASDARTAGQLQTQISGEIEGILGTAEQGAISLSAQQSSLAQAETQATAPELMQVIAEDLIEQGDESISRDWGKQIGSGFLGAAGGAVAGAIGGFTGPKLFNKAKTGGLFARTALGIGTVGTGAFTANLIHQSINNLSGNEGDESANWLEPAMTYGALGVGGGLGLASSAPNIYRDIKNAKAAGGGWAGYRAAQGQRVAATAAKTASRTTTAATKGLGKAAGKGLLKGISKGNLALTAIMATTGAIIGGVAAGSKARYAMDYDKFAQSALGKDFAQMGIALQDIEAIVER